MSNTQKDGLYRVTTNYLCAGFVVEGGEVVRCAPILRKRLAHWVTVAERVVSRRTGYSRQPRPGYRYLGDRMSEQIVLLRTSERSTYKRCRQAWDWAYNEWLRSRSLGRALRFGDLVHQALAIYYPPGKERGPHPAETFRTLYLGQLEELGRMTMDSEEDGKVDAEDLGVAMMNNYVTEYGLDERWEIIQPEMPMAIDIRDHRGRYMVTYVMRGDAVIRDRSRKKRTLGLFEHKTSGSAEKSGTPLALDEQGGTYWALMPDWLKQSGHLPKKAEFDFILYNILRKGAPDDRPVNELGQKLNKPTKEALWAAVEEYQDHGLKKSGKMEDMTAFLESQGVDVPQLGEPSKNQPAPFFHREFIYRSDGDKATQLGRIRAEVREMQMARNGELAIIKAPAEHCKWCDFRDMCEVHETGSDWESMKDGLFVVQDPYADYGEFMDQYERSVNGK